MRKSIKIIPLTILTILSILIYTGRVRFGFGMGDIFYYGIVYLSLIIYTIYLIGSKRLSNKLNKRLLIISMFFCGYLILKMTIWRGGEYPWNGDILTPTQKTREKRKKQKFEKGLLVYEKQVELDTQDYNIRIEKGFYLRSNGKYELAIKEFKKAQELAPENYRAYWEAGYAFKLKKDYKNMILEYEKAYEADTTNQKLKSQIINLKGKYKKE